MIRKWGVGFVLVSACVSVVRAGTLEVQAKRKPDQEWTSYETRTVESLRGYRPKTIKVNAYGSRLDKRAKRTGYFYAIEKRGRWWLVDPEGYLNVNRSIVSVNMGKGPSQRAAFDSVFGSEREWAKETVALLKAHGFNGTGAWTNDELLRKVKDPLVYCMNWRFMATFGTGRTELGSGHIDYPQDCIFVFDPEWEDFCEKHARKHVSELKKDPYLLGHFFDNELPLKPRMIERYLKLPERDPGHRAAKAFIKEREGKRGTLDDLSESDVRDFDDLVMEKYLGTIARAIKKVDPNHMLLGPRLYSTNASMELMGSYVDAFAYNLYGKWSPGWKAEKLFSEIGKPLLVTEFYVKGMDVAGLSNQSGAGWSVATQADRGRFYQNYVLDLLESKVCVGWQWLRYQDNDPGNTNVDASNLNSNKGIVNNQYEVYEPLMSRMKELNTQVYSIIDHFD